MGQVREFEGVRPQIDGRAWLDPTSLVIGDVHVGADASLWPGVVARGDINRIRIGRATNIQDGSVLHNSHDGPFMPGGAALIVGARVTVGHRAILHGCTIGDECLIGMGAVIMDRVQVEPHVVVGAGSLVPPGKVLRSGFLYTGTPARQVRELEARELSYLAYSADYYVALAGRHRAMHRG
jgi:carbonic anhydrase/acetyltransferase-like protein (isoleucine patch superfamily)